MTAAILIFNKQQNIVIAGEPVAVVDPEAAAFDKANNVWSR